MGDTGGTHSGTGRTLFAVTPPGLCLGPLEGAEPSRSGSGGEAGTFRGGAPRACAAAAPGAAAMSGLCDPPGAAAAPRAPLRYRGG